MGIRVVSEASVVWVGDAAVVQADDAAVVRVVKSIVISNPIFRKVSTQIEFLPRSQQSQPLSPDDCQDDATQQQQPLCPAFPGTASFDAAFPGTAAIGEDAQRRRRKKAEKRQSPEEKRDLGAAEMDELEEIGVVRADQSLSAPKTKVKQFHRDETG